MVGSKASNKNIFKLMLLPLIFSIILLQLELPKRMFSDTVSSGSTSDNKFMPGNKTKALDLVVLPRSKVYLCGWLQQGPESPFLLLFPNHTFVPLTASSGPPELSIASATDVLVTSETPASGCKNVWRSESAFYDWVPKFPGKVLYRNGEASLKWWRGRISDNLYFAGYYPDSRENRTMHFTWMQMILLGYGPKEWDKLLRPENKPASRRERFLIAAVSRCIDFRQEALRRLGHIDVVDCVGKCCDSILPHSIWQSPPKDNPMQRPDGKLVFPPHKANIQYFAPYRFCLVMENTNVDGYISEKILNAFLAGCVPIWYGTREIFDIFNTDAFIYYDVNDPDDSALARVQELESNQTAYDEIMQQPILANGEDTIKEYFSFHPALGGGELVKRLHRLMEL